MEVLLLGLHFYIKDPECVNNTVNLSLSAGSEASMVTQILDAALYANTLTPYTDATTLMKQ